MVLADQKISRPPLIFKRDSRSLIWRFPSICEVYESVSLLASCEHTADRVIRLSRLLECGTKWIRPQFAVIDAKTFNAS